EALTAPGSPAQEGAVGSATLESLAGDRAAASARLEALEQQRRERQTELDRLVFEIQSSERALTEVTRQAEDLRSAVERADAARVRAATELEQARKHEEDIGRRSAEASKEAAQHRTRLASLETRRALLEEVTQESAQVESRLVDGARQGRFRWKGRLSQVLQVPDAYRPALAAALGPFAEAFGLPTANDVESVLQAIAEGEDSSTAALLRLDIELSSPPLPPIDDPDFVGIAADLVQAPAEYRPALRALIGRTLVVRSRAAAMRILDRVRLDDVRVVTLHGELFLPGGHVLVGEGKVTSAARRVSLKSVAEDLARAREAAAASEARSASLESELRETRRQIAALSEASDRAMAAAEQARSQHAEKNAASQAARQHLEFLHGRRESLRTENAELEERIGAETLRKDEVDSAYARLELETKRADLSAGKESGAIHLAQAEAHLQLARSAVEEARGRLSELQTTWAERDTSRQARAARREALNAEQAQLRSEISTAGEQMKSIEARLASLAAEAAPAEKTLGEAEEARAALEREESRLRSEVQAAERSHAQAQIELARREEELSSLQRRVEDDFGLVAFDFDETTATQAPLPFEGLVEHLSRVEELSPDVEGQVNRLRLQLRRMGAINPEAQKEYLEVKERVEFLTTQLADLRKAEGQLQGVITELDELMQREFQRTFEAVTVEFKKAFTRLFAGGSARLTLTDPNDLTQTGIDIEARLPGRREQGLSMLSGGERSLTACALVFALLKVSPTPFCVLDEVDAMLDESNVTRFREMLHELSGETQFIVITHNRQTVQAADVIYGVSMGPDSASRVISLKLDEAQSELAA
ncbi:MAG TPA: hypothetical protein VFI11_00100, partial [Anaerolineales bacterium]|nr:hypothetical protein [Anaerolineales bacterium]